MKTIVSISSDPFSFLKLRKLDEEIGKNDEIALKVVFFGDPAEVEEVQSIIGHFHHEPKVIDMDKVSIAQQTARAFLECETIFSLTTVDLLLVPDASNAAMASALLAIKRHIPVLSLDAGLRSNDRRKHSEINRKAIDSIAEIFFTSEDTATKNLKAEGVDENVIYEVGSLLEESFQDKNVSGDGDYVFCSFTHPSNEHDPVFYRELIPILNDLSKKREIIIALENDVVEVLKERNLLQNLDGNIKVIEPPSVAEMLDLVKNAALVLTDDEKAQLLTSALEKQCITFGNVIENPFTVAESTNHLVGIHLHELRNLSLAILEGYQKKKKKARLSNASSNITETLKRL